MGTGAGTRAAVYCRISQDRSGEGLGVERQLEDCRKLCERNGWPVAEELIDNDVSAYSGKRREGYERLLTGLKTGAYDAVVAWHPDRITRQPRELEDLIDVLEASGAAVATVTSGEYDLASPTGRMQARIVGAVARHESEHHAERTRRKREQQARAGSFGGGPRPFGYQLAPEAPGGLIVDRNEAALIRSAYKTVLRGGSLSAVVREWTEKAPKRSWYVSYVKTVLLRPGIAGIATWQGKTIGTTKYPAIVKAEDQAALRRLLAGNARPSVGAVYLLTGLATCGVCGARLRARRRFDRRNGAPTYFCDNGQHVAISMPVFDEFVSERFLAVVTDPALLEQLAPTSSSAERHDFMEKLSEAERTLTELAEDYGDGTITRAEFHAARTKALQRAEAAQNALNRLVAPPSLPSPKTAFKAWERAEVGQRRAWLRALIDSVDLRQAETRGVADPKRITVLWRV